jgi:hypothetical protein
MNDSEYFMFAEDVALGSLSAAAAVINAGNANGRTLWKICDTGQTYQECYEQELAAAEVAGEKD